MIKIINKACQILATLFSVAALVFFFFNFATLLIDGVGNTSVSGLEIAFGSKIEAVKSNIAISADVLFCFVLGVLGLAMTVFTYFSKSKLLKYLVVADNAVIAVYMLVIRLSNPWKFVDSRFIDKTLKVTDIDYSKFVLFIVIAMFLALAASIAFVLISDRIEVIESKGAKKTIFKKIVHFFKDYKSECKKIVWPGIKDVIKNTGIVLIMFIIIGAVIWLVDFGLATFLKSIWK